MRKSFGCPKLFQIIGRFSTNFSALWDKNNQQKKDTTNIRKILKPEHFWNTDGFTHDDFRRRETKKFNKMVIACYPNFFRYQNLSEKQASPYEIFRHCETKTIDRIVILLLSRTIWYQKISETQNGSSTMIFGDVRQNNSTKLWYPYYLKTFDTRTFVKHRRARPRYFRRLGTKKLRRKNLTPPFLSINFSRTRKFLEHKRVPHEVFRYCETKLFPRKIVEHFFHA